MDPRYRIASYCIVLHRIVSYSIHSSFRIHRCPNRVVPDDLSLAASGRAVRAEDATQCNSPLWKKQVNCNRHATPRHTMPCGAMPFQKRLRCISLSRWNGYASPPCSAVQCSAVQSQAGNRYARATIDHKDARYAYMHACTHARMPATISFSPVVRY